MKKKGTQIMDMTEEMILEMADNLMAGEINPFTTLDCLKADWEFFDLVQSVWEAHERRDVQKLMLQTHLEQCYSLPAFE